MHKMLSKTSIIRQKSIAEMIVGDIIKHEFYFQIVHIEKKTLKKQYSYVFGNYVNLKSYIYYSTSSLIETTPQYKNNIRQRISHYKTAVV